MGAVLIGIVLTCLSMKGVQYYYQGTAKGVVLIVALVFSFTLSRKKSRYVPAT